MRDQVGNERRSTEEVLSTTESLHGRFLLWAAVVESLGGVLQPCLGEGLDKIRRSDSELYDLVVSSAKTNVEELWDSEEPYAEYARIVVTHYMGEQIAIEEAAILGLECRRGETRRKLGRL